MARTKTAGFFFKMTPEEEEMFERRMAQTGIKNKSAFIRKMCIDGHVFSLDMPELDEIKRLIGIAGNNLNQLTRRANYGIEPYRKDIAELNEQFTEIRVEFGRVLAKLTDIADAKPGKRFVPPPTIRDMPWYSSEPSATREAT